MWLRIDQDARATLFRASLNTGLHYTPVDSRATTVTLMLSHQSGFREQASGHGREGTKMTLHLATGLCDQNTGNDGFFMHISATAPLIDNLHRASTPLMRVPR